MSRVARPARGIDHVVILVRDIDGAEARFRRLGFNLTPRGHHSRLKSYNHCAMLAGGDYLELLTTGERGARPYYNDFLARREGVAGIAFRTGDARTTRDALASHGFRPEEPVAFGRPVEIDGGTREARFVTVTVDPAIPLGARTFFCQHETPELVWRPSYLPQPNTARGLATVTFVGDGMDLAGHYARLLGGEVARTAEGAALDLDAQRLEFLTPPAAAARFAGDPVLRLTPPYIAAIRLAVTDPAASEQSLRRAGMPHRRTAEGSLRVASSDAAGVILEFA
jgi:catechol 2,3-dioxygenase-like lactoylglutathione lyase family enzyme